MSTSSANIDISKNQDVDHFEYTLRDPLAMVGTVTEIKLTNGETIKGQTIADYPSKIVILADDGIRHVIPYSNIMSKGILPYNTHRPLGEQLKYLSRISYLDEDNKTAEVNGVIIRKIVYKPSGSEKPYYEVVNADGTSPRNMAFDNVKSIRLSPNNKFVQERDLSINDNEIFIQGQKAQNTFYSAFDDRYQFNDTIGAVHINYNDLNKGYLKVNYKNNPDHEFIFVEVNRQVLNDNSNRKNSNTKVPIWCAKLSDILLCSISPSDKYISPATNVTQFYIR